MPIYEYECTQCQRQFDVMQKISDPAITRCSFCNAESARRLVSASGFQLKGSGWYVSDYKPNISSNKTSEAASDTAPVSE